eukprot:13511121-Heterocapsa_arctica.AAC.1
MRVAMTASDIGLLVLALREQTPPASGRGIPTGQVVVHAVRRACPGDGSSVPAGWPDAAA